MLQLPLTDAAHELERLRHQLTDSSKIQAASLTENGKPVLAVLPWNLYETLLAMARLPADPEVLLAAPPDVRSYILAEAVAQAEEVYRTDPDLTDFEAFGEGDLYDDYDGIESPHPAKG